MKPLFEYKGYFGSAEVNVIDNILQGRLMFISDIVTYIADSPASLKTAFEEAVDDYLQTCAELGDEPNVPFKGTFNVRVGPDRHKNTVLACSQQGISLNDWVCRAIDASLAPIQEPPISNHITVNLYAPQPREQRIAPNAQPESWGGRLIATPAMPVQH
jgi:predicted HicB family RNase H-like nuclease